MTANVLNTWKEIAAYVDRGVRTVQRWEQELGFPVRRPRGKQRSAVIAIKSEIDSWLKAPQRDAVPGTLVLRRRPARISKPLLENATTLTTCYDFLKKELKRAIAIDSALKATCKINKAQKLKTDALRRELRLRLDSLRKQMRRARVLAKVLHASTANGNGASLNSDLVQVRKLRLSGGGNSGASSWRYQPPSLIFQAVLKIVGELSQTVSSVPGTLLVSEQLYPLVSSECPRI